MIILTIGGAEDSEPAAAAEADTVPTALLP